MWRLPGARDFFCDFLAGAEAGIDQAFRRQPIQRAAIGIHPRRLARHWLFPCQAQPGQNLENRTDKFVPRPSLIQVLDAQAKMRAILPRHDRGKGMTQMQIAGWRRRKSCHTHFVMVARPDGKVVSVCTLLLSNSWPLLPRNLIALEKNGVAFAIRSQPSP